MRNLRRWWMVAMIVALVAQGFAPTLAWAHQADATAVAAAVRQEDDPRPYVPADLPAGTAVTLAVDPLEVAAGESFTVGGLNAAGATPVRIAIVRQGMTLGVREVIPDADGVFSAQIPSDPEFPPGPVQVCAFATGAADAQVVCSPLTVTPPANGSVAGQLPLEGVRVAERGALDAEILLMNAAGAVLYSAPIGAAGNFAIDDVAPGAYLYAVRGRVPTLADAGVIAVEPGRTRQLNLAVRRTCGIVSVLRPTTALTATPSREAFLHRSRYNGLTWETQTTRRPFGLYVTGVENIVTFTAAPQTTGVVDKVIFEFFGVNGQVIERLEDSSPPYAVPFDVGRLPASQGEIHPFVSVTPVVGGSNACASVYDIEVMGNPMSSPYLQPLPASRTTWNGAARTYEFEGILPYVEDVLPARYNLGDVPFLGTIRNEFNTGVYIKGLFDLEGKARIYLAEVFADAVLLSLPLLPPGQTRETITPPGLSQVQFDIRNPAHLAIPYGPLTLYQKDLISIPFAKILVFTYFGIVNAYIAGGLHFGVGLYLEGEVRPLIPAVDSTLSGVAEFRAELGLSIDLLLGLVEGGGGLGGRVCVGLPLRVILAQNPNVFFDDPFVGGQLYLVFWASALWGLVKTRTTAPLEDFGPGCPGAAVAQADPPAPDVFRSPAVATSPGGGMLAAYVENTAAPGATPQVQIMAQFQDGNTGEWSDAVAISDPAHSAQSPSVAFIGANQTPLVVWAENTLTAEEAAVLGDADPVGHLRHLEIYYAVWNDGWQPPVRLTTNELPDGLPEVAGNLTTSVLAWTTDLDGDATTRTDQRILVSIYDPFVQAFPQPVELALDDGVLPAGGLNNDVDVAVDDAGNAYIVWVHDADGDLTTADDRRLEVAYGSDGEWTSLNPQPLPPRVDSPSITVTPDGVQLAFLVREATPEDDEVGLLGTNGVLWAAHLNGEQVWTYAPVQDRGGESIYAEAPELARDQSAALLVFRRFDDRTVRGGLGQLSMSRLTEFSDPTPPLTLTDAAAQQWLPTLAVNPANGRAVVIHSALQVSSARIAQAPSLAATQALPATQSGTLAASDSPVLYLSLDPAADPALDPLQTSHQVPMPGASLTVTATVRNVGRGATGDLMVSLYRGDSAAGELLAAQAVAGPLDLNATAVVVFSVTAPETLGADGRFAFYAAVTATSGDNASAANDGAGVTLGGLAAPGPVRLVGESLDTEQAADLVWSGGAGEYVTGYRILRAAGPSGPWVLVGESAVPAFTDTNLTYEQTYCYAVQAYNDQGAFSAQGAAACHVFTRTPAANRLLLPVLARP